MSLLSYRALLLFILAICVSTVVFREYILADGFKIATNGNDVSFAHDKFIEPALHLDFSFEHERGFGTVHVEALQWHSLHFEPGSPRIVDFRIRLTDRHKWSYSYPTDDKRLVQNELLPQIAREIDERLGGDTGTTFVKDRIRDCLIERLP